MSVALLQQLNFITGFIMSNNPDPSKILFGTEYNYFLNYNNSPASASITGASVAAGKAVSYSLSIPITNIQDFAQIQINYSFDSTKWYVFPVLDLTLDANFSVSTVGAFSGSNFVLTFYVVNQTAGTQTHSSFNVSANAYLFVTPS